MQKNAMKPYYKQLLHYTSFPFMARLLKTGQKLLLIAANKTSYSIGGLVGTHFARTHTSAASASASAPLTSPLESNILRIIRKEIDYQLQYAPPHQPVSNHDTFTVEDHPGEQWVTLKSKSPTNENIKIEATMFDGFVEAPQVGGEGCGVNPRLHLSLLIDVWKGEGPECLEFVCSAWPDRLEIQKVFIFKRNGLPIRPYMGPDIRNMKRELKAGFYDYLKTRGVNDDLSVFLHGYMTNKDRVELIQWFKKVESVVES